MRSNKHPNWTIEKNGNCYFMQHDQFKGYMIEVSQAKDGQWFGSILTEQKIQDLPGETEWLEAQINPMYAPIEEVKREVVKRGQYWQQAR